MAGENLRARERNAWALAERQHGIITRQDLLDLGFTHAAIEHRIARGRLHPIYRGVYAVGWPPVTHEGRWMAAILACGEKAALSHRSAAALWGIAREGRRIDVSVRRDCRRRRFGVHARGRPSLAADDVTTHKRIPVTCIVRTLVDLATVASLAELERAVNEADKLDLIDTETLRMALDDYAGQPGVKKLRTLLDRETFCLSDSELERLFRRVIAAVGLPTPLTKTMVNGFEVDFFWPGLGLIVETDGLRYHRTPAVQARDHFRDQTHTAAGLTRLRFTHRQVKYQRGHVVRVLRSTAQRLRSEH